MYLSVNKNYSKTDCKLAKAEKNDCVVRSIAAATGVSYRTAHAFCKEEMGREDKKGTNNMLLSTTFLKAQDDGLKLENKEFEVYGLKKAEVKNRYKLKGEIIDRKKTVKSFIKDHQKGTYIVTVSKHAFVVKDGNLIDNFGEEFRPTRKVDGAYRINVPEKTIQLSLFN